MGELQAGFGDLFVTFCPIRPDWVYRASNPVVSFSRFVQARRPLTTGIPHPNGGG